MKSAQDASSRRRASNKQEAESVRQPNTMASLLLTGARNKQYGYLSGVVKKIAALKETCDDPERQEQDKFSAAIATLEKA